MAPAFMWGVMPCLIWLYGIQSSHLQHCIPSPLHAFLCVLLPYMCVGLLFFYAVHACKYGICVLSSLTIFGICTEVGRVKGRGLWQANM